MALQLGRLTLQTRGKNPGKCTFCRHELESYELYVVLRQYRKGGPGSGMFFITLHPGCVSDYFHKSWDRHMAKDIHESGRRPGSRGVALRKFDEIELIVRASKLQSRRRLIYLIRHGESPARNYFSFEKVLKIDLWLEEIGDETWADKMHLNPKERNQFRTKLDAANQWGVSHGLKKLG